MFHKAFMIFFHIPKRTQEFVDFANMVETKGGCFL
jgi:hypothetical protein